MDTQESGTFLSEHRHLFDGLERLKREIDELENTVTAKKQEAAKIEEQIVVVMDDAGVPRITIGDITYFRKVDRYPRVPEGGQDELFRWLQGEGRGDLIKPAVNIKSLGSFLKERREDQNMEDPSCVEMYQVNRVGIRRK